MSRMALTRTGSTAYKRYLRSQAWAWRRQRWFRDRRAEGTEPACQVCGLRLEETNSLDLHHLSYDGVISGDDGRWQAKEKDEDLWPFCRAHHRLLHRRMDRGQDFYGWDRARATVVITAYLYRSFHRETTTRQKEAGTTP